MAGESHLFAGKNSVEDLGKGGSSLAHGDRLRHVHELYVHVLLRTNILVLVTMANLGPQPACWTTPSQAKWEQVAVAHREVVSPSWHPGDGPSPSPTVLRVRGGAMACRSQARR